MSKQVKLLLATAALACAALALATPAGAGKGMRSTELGNRLCKTSGGGKFVGIPDFPGERIDRRLLSDIRWMERRWDILVTDGYSDDGVHAANGEHPIGLAADIVPNKAAGGTWKQIDRLAAWAEPVQDQPRAPFRWVGYDGDAGHGRKNHLHLSWSHSDTKPFTPARTVYTVRCPGEGGAGNGDGGGGGDGGGKGDGGKGDGGGGGIQAGSGGKDGGKKDGKGGHGGGGITQGDGGGDHNTGGVGLRTVERRIERQQASGSSVETGGIGLRQRDRAR